MVRIVIQGDLEVCVAWLAHEPPIVTLQRQLSISNVTESTLGQSNFGEQCLEVLPGASTRILDACTNQGKDYIVNAVHSFCDVFLAQELDSLSLQGAGATVNRVLHIILGEDQVAHLNALASSFLDTV